MDELDDMDQEEKENWRVIKAEPEYGEPEADLYFLYFGEKEVPDVVGLSLSDARKALKSNEFSSVDYESNDGSSIWDTDNWEVLYQSVPAGTMHHANEDISLIVQSYRSIEEDGRAVIDGQISDTDSSSEADSTNNEDSVSEEDKETLDESSVKTDEASTDNTPSIPEEESQESTEEKNSPDTSDVQSNNEQDDMTEETPLNNEQENMIEEKPLNQNYSIDYSSQETIKAVQAALNAAGFDCGSVDGIIGNNTRNKITEFKKVHSINGNDEINLDLIIALGIDPEALETENTEAVSQKNDSIITPKENAVFYSTNSRATVDNGNSGIYSYKNRGGSYDIYYIIDFNAGYVYYFTNGNGNDTCDRLKIDNGTLNDVVIITYHDSGYSWSEGLHFKYVNNSEHLIVQDNDGFELDFYTTDLNNALSIRNTKNIHDY